MLSIIKKPFCIITVFLLLVTSCFASPTVALADDSVVLSNPYEKSSVISDLTGSVSGFIEDYFDINSLENKTVSSINNKIIIYSIGNED